MLRSSSPVASPVPLRLALCALLAAGLLLGCDNNDPPPTLVALCVEEDLDEDGWSNDCDNCPGSYNPGQADLDSDGLGDACDPCPGDAPPSGGDRDGDEVLDDCDNCGLVSNPDQADADLDGAGDACDRCPLQWEPRQLDQDADGVGDACDNCPGLANEGQADSDGDGAGDACSGAPARKATLTISLQGGAEISGINVSLHYPLDLTFRCADPALDCSSRAVGLMEDALFFLTNGSRRGRVSMAALLSVSESVRPPGDIFELDFHYTGEPPSLEDFSIRDDLCHAADEAGHDVDVECLLSELELH